MKTIYLIGFMGAGKTTVGKALGRYMSVPVFDTDEVIERKEQLTINAIFEQYKEAYFRELETKILQEIPTENAVVTTGGGIVCKHENRIFLNNNGVVIFLYADEDEIVKRLEQDESRPLLKGDKKEKIVELYGERLPIYKEAADYLIDTTGKEINEIVKEISICLNLS